MTLIEEIKDGVSSLIQSDQELARMFIERRNFVGLKELVDSNIWMLINNRSKEVPDPKFEDIEESDLCILKMNIEEYLRPYEEEII